jgi:hypothetical protein
VLQQGRDVLTDIMVPRTSPEIFGMPVVVLQRAVRDFFQLLWIELHV